MMSSLSSTVVLILLVAYLLVYPATGALWFLTQLKLSAVGGGDGNQNGRVLCDLMSGMNSKQRKMCQTYPEILSLVSRGVRVGVAECQYQFRAQRWNCTTMDKQPGGKIILKLGSREAAFVHAISSAGVTHTIARGCSQGRLSACSCQRLKHGNGIDKQGEFQWGGCSDNVQFAAGFSRRFIDSGEGRTRDPMAVMNLHNNRAGRKAVRRSVHTECKCHGVSGSCTIRTCWKSVSPFRKVGTALHHKYSQALQVTARQDGKSLIPLLTPPPPPPVRTAIQYDYVSNRYATNVTRFKFNRLSSAQISKSELVFFEASPDYCHADSKTGSIGTSGRECNVTTAGPSGCDVMCCGRGYDTKSVTKQEKCQCRFVWCCRVECKICSIRQEIYTCKPPSLAETNGSLKRNGFRVSQMNMGPFRYGSVHRSSFD